MELKIIGTVSSQVKEPINKDWGKITSEIRVTPEYTKRLTGLDGSLTPSSASTYTELTKTQRNI